MSYTGIYGPFHFDGDPDSVEIPDRAPLIVDRDRWDEIVETHEWSHIFDDQAVIEEYQAEGYPRKAWDSLVGFRSFEDDVITELNIDRIAYGYNSETFEAFWSLVGECTEPFWFAHSGEDNHWPTSDWYDFDDPDPSYSERVYQVHVDGTDVDVAKGEIVFTGFGEVES